MNEDNFKPVQTISDFIEKYGTITPKLLAACCVSPAKKKYEEADFALIAMMCDLEIALKHFAENIHASVSIWRKDESNTVVCDGVVSSLEATNISPFIELIPGEVPTYRCFKSIKMITSMPNADDVFDDDDFNWAAIKKFLHLTDDDMVKVWSPNTNVVDKKIS